MAAIRPAVLVVDFGGGWFFQVGAVIEVLAIVGFAAAYLEMFRRSERRRIGFYVFIVAVAAGVVVSGLGSYMAVGGMTSGAATIHARVALTGFLGLAIVGVSFQFYPPAVASLPGISDQTAGLAVVLIGSGLGLEIGGLVGNIPVIVSAGRWLTATGAVVYAVVLFAVFAEHTH